MLFFGSVCGLFSIILLCYKLKISWYILFKELIYSIRCANIAMHEIMLDLLNAKHNKTDLPLMSGRIAIVTGGSKGIGASVSKLLLQCDIEVIIACRNLKAGEELICKIRNSGVKTGQAKVYKLDNASLESIREFAKQIKLNYNKINILINNAGIMGVPYEETKDGFEHQWEVNYLAHFLLTSLLLPLLKAGGSPKENSRIVNVSSCIQKIDTMRFDNINKSQYIPMAAYTQSKLAQAVFTKALQERIYKKDIHTKVYTVHPGIVKTELFQKTYINKYMSLIYYILKTPEQGAIPIVYAATNKDIENKGGICIGNCKEYSENSQTSDSSIQDRLFQLSLKQAQLRDFFQYL